MPNLVYARDGLGKVELVTKVANGPTHIWELTPAQARDIATQLLNQAALTEGSQTNANSSIGATGREDIDLWGGTGGTGHSNGSAL